jgi:hypothetical protein
MASTVLFNSVLTNPQHKHSQLLALIATHPSFRAAVNDYYQILNLSPTTQSVTHLGTLFFTLLLPEYPLQQTQGLAGALLDHIRSHPSKVTYHNLTEYLLKLCTFAVESIDVRNAIGFLELLKSRITDTFIISAVDPSKRRKVSTEFKLEIMEGESVLSDSGLL